MRLHAPSQASQAPEPQGPCGCDQTAFIGSALGSWDNLRPSGHLQLPGPRVGLGVWNGHSCSSRAHSCLRPVLSPCDTAGQGRVSAKVMEQSSAQGTPRAGALPPGEQRWVSAERRPGSRLGGAAQGQGAPPRKGHLGGVWAQRPSTQKLWAIDRPCRWARPWQK